MIRRVISIVSPFALKASRPNFASFSSCGYRGLQVPQRSWFCQEKNNKSKEKPERKEEKESVESEQKEEEIKKEEKEIKLEDMSTEELVQINSEQSLHIVEKRIIALEKKHQKQEKIIKELEQKLTYLEKHHTDLTEKEKILLENLKEQERELVRIHKRSEKEVEDSKDYAITKLAKELIETADNIKRCKDYAEKLVQENPDDLFIQKIILSHKQMADLLKLYEIEEFDPTGEPFDPNHSESLVTIPCPPGYQVNNVAMAMQTGYRIKSRILRSARVGIFV